MQFDNIEYFAKTQQNLCYRENAYISLRGDEVG